MIFSCDNRENKKVDLNENNKTNNKTNNMSLNIIEIKKHIELQRRIGSDEIEYEKPYILTEKDLDLLFKVIDEGLIKKGYKMPSLEKFNDIIKINNSKELNYAKYFDVDCFEWKNKNFFTNFQLVESDQYIFTNKKCISGFFLLDEVIHVNADDTYSIQLPKVIIARNKYLFNESKADLVWLKFNDEYFLESLVKVFGYVKDKDLLKWVLDRSLNDDKSKEKEFYKILVTKTCDNKYIFHKEVFEVMTQADAKSKENYLNFLIGRINLPKIEGLSFSEDTRIKALYCYYATKIDKNYMFSFFPKLDDEKLEEEFKRNNYYNIPDFKELFEQTKNGGIGLPM